MAAQILLLHGMTPHASTFRRLCELVPSATEVSWIAPLPNETIAAHADRLAASVAIRDRPIVCGLSFGGVLARELAWRWNARACVLVASIRDVQQLPPWIRWCRPLAQLPLGICFRAIGGIAACVPRGIRNTATARITKFHGESGKWHRWATWAFLRWQSVAELDRITVVQIHGDRDTTFPLRYIHADIVVSGAGHILPITHPEVVATVLLNLAATP